MLLDHKSTLLPQREKEKLGMTQAGQRLDSEAELGRAAEARVARS
jgi:hypothetical protein